MTKRINGPSNTNDQREPQELLVDQELLHEHLLAINILAKAIKSNRLVVFVGSGLSVGAGLPSWSEITEIFAQELGYEDPILSGPKIAQFYETHFGRNALVRRLKELLDPEIPPTQMHQLVTQLDASVYITTNFDYLLERVLLLQNIAFQKIVADENVAYWDNTKTQLVKIHGSLENESSIIISEDDYYHFFSKKKNIIKKVTGILLDNIILFIGYGLGDYDFNQLYLSIKSDLGKESPLVYSLQLNANSFEAKSWEHRGIKILNMSDSVHLFNFLTKLLNVADKLISPLRVSAKASYSIDLSIRKKLIPFLKRIEHKWLITNAARYYITQRATTLDNKKITDVGKYLIDQLTSHRSVILLGSSGLGKSVLCLFVAKELATDSLKNKGNCLIPIYIDLSNIEFVRSYAYLLEFGLQNSGENFSNDDISYLDSKYQLIFVLDGFDEIGCRSDLLKSESSLRNILQILTDSKHVILLICRTQYFKSIEQIENLTNNIQILNLEQWSTNEIKTYVRQIKRKSSKSILERINSVHNLPDLCSTPLLLQMVLDSISKLTEETEVSSVQLYDLYTKQWLSREDAQFFLPWSDKENFVSSLAWKMFLHDVPSIHYMEIESEIDEKYRPNFSEKNYLSYSIRSRSFLTRDEQGFYRFQHRSFMEFYVAKRLIEALHSLDFETFGTRQVYHDISIFMRGLIRQKNIPLLIDCVSDSTTNEICRFHAANLLTTSFTVSTNIELPKANLLERLESCLESETSIMVARQIVYVICFLKGSEGAVKFLERLKRNPKEDDEDTFYALRYFGKSRADAIKGHLKHLRDPKYHNHLIMDLYHLGKIGDKSVIPELEPFKNHSDPLVRKYSTEAIEKIASHIK